LNHQPKSNHETRPPAVGIRPQLVEDDFDGCEIGVIVEMLFLDVQHDGVLGMVKRERAVTLIALNRR